MGVSAKTREGNEAEKLLKLAARQMLGVLETVDMEKVKIGLDASLDGKSADAYLEYIGCVLKVIKELQPKGEEDALRGSAWTGAGKADLDAFDKGVLGGDAS